MRDSSLLHTFHLQLHTHQHGQIAPLKYHLFLVHYEYAFDEILLKHIALHYQKSSHHEYLSPLNIVYRVQSQ